MGVDRKGMMDSSVDKFTSLKVNNIPNERGMDLLQNPHQNELVGPQNHPHW